MKKARIWPSSLVILGLGVAGSFASAGSQLFSLQCPVRVETPGAGTVYRETLSHIESRYPGKVDAKQLARGVSQAVNREVNRSGASFSLLPFVQTVYLPSQPEKYIGCAPLPSGRAWQAAARGLVAGLEDPQARYLSPAEVSASQTLSALPMNGIGAVLMHDPSERGLLIGRVLDGHPALRAGMQAGDRVVAVNGQSTEGMGVYQGMHLLRGLAGTQLELGIERNGQVYELSLMREPLVLGSSVTASAGTIRVNWLDYSTADLVTMALQTDPARSVVLDLRDVGALDTPGAVRIVSNFVPAGSPVGRIESADGRVQDLRTATGPAASGPVTVLVNERTWGSAELIASALQAHGARVVGTRTAGMPSSVQRIGLSDGSALELPVERTLSASGEVLDRVGVTPDSKL